MDYFKTVAKQGSTEFKDKGSRFIAYVHPVSSVDEFKKILAGIKKEHPKAVHHCFAYRLGFDKSSFRQSDDGEPGGTAGKQILGQIDSKQLTNVAVIVVRYFGGILLGVPGLIHAYKTVTQLGLQVTPIEEKSIEINYNIHCSYPMQNDVMTILKANQCTLVSVSQNLFCDMVVGMPKNRLQQALHALKDLYGVEVTLAAT
jgi:uncharacterized YigZ family protein